MAHFDVVMNLRKNVAVIGVEAPRVREAQEDLAALVERARAKPDVAARGLQGVHAEVMRHLVSKGNRNFPEFGDVRHAYQASLREVDS